MRLLIVTDAWLPQINGVVRTLDTLRQGLERRGHQVRLVTPDLFRTIPCPTYPEIRLALFPGRRVAAMIEDFQPQAIHIATEGPLGVAARAHCLKQGYPFTTAYHTRFPEYVHARVPLPLSWLYAVMKWFHGPSSAIMVATQTIEDDLIARGFRPPVRRWSRGVWTDLFKPRDKAFLDAPRPISLFTGRVAVEKNIEAFLKLDLPGTKYVVGDGPQLDDLKRKYPAVRFAGVKEGEELAKYFAAADVFVFPSRTDTFGLVLLEAMASGVPVAAYPVPGPLDVVNQSGAGVLSDDLAAAVTAALAIPAEACRNHALKYSWDASFDQFEGNLHVFR
ncbi:MAG: alpha-mannosyltransferase [Rhodospirillaceae bacterium]|nr:alpha-mannosyltransferase [Rhodospirillaceae bacterium]